MLDIMFPLCSVKANKSSKKTAHQSSRSNDANQSNNNSSINNSNNSSNSNNINSSSSNSSNGNIGTKVVSNSNNNMAGGPQYRFVTTKFDAQLVDELSVVPGDGVLFEYADGDWSHVLCFRTNKRGFIPSQYLSTESKRNPECKKKLPRSKVDNAIESPHHLHHDHQFHRSHHHNSIDFAFKNDDYVRMQRQHLREHQSKFDIPQSLRGSSGGKQSFHNYPDLGQLSPPAYYNIHSTDHHYSGYEMECRLFRIENYGLYMVMNNFVAREENDLNVSPGDYVTVLNKDDEDWYWVRRGCDMAEGFVPSRFICDYERVNSILNKGNSTVTMKSSNLNDCHTYINHGPDRDNLTTEQQSSLFQPL